MQQHYFSTAWAASGDLTVGGIPMTVDPNGFVSYVQGFTYDYQRNLASDSQAKQIQRVTLNSALNDITVALQNLQQNGSPEFITAANNGGSPYPYGQGAIVRYSGSGVAPFTLYFSTVADNVATPGSSLAWVNLSALFSVKSYVLTAGLTLYVTQGGNDNNPGTQAAPFLTIQAAVNAALGLYRWAGYPVFINVGNGNFAGASINSTADGQLVALQITGAGSGQTTINGNIGGGSNPAIQASGGNVQISGCTLEGGRGVYAGPGGTVSVANDVIFGACDRSHIGADGGFVFVLNSYSYNGNTLFHYETLLNGSVQISAPGVVATCIGNVTFNTFCTASVSGAFLSYGNLTFGNPGQVTGTRYSSTKGGVIDTETGNVNFFPGTVAGSTGSGTATGFYS